MMNKNHTQKTLHQEAIKTKYRLINTGWLLWSYRGYRIRNIMDGGYIVLSKNGGRSRISAPTLEGIRQRIDAVQKEK